MNYYTTERSIQILIYLMKQHGIKKVVISPGATNVTLVASLQQDEYFQLYSCVDERSAAYMATGLAFESGEAVAISCTGATSSRNYLPALTEAYYRKIPILAITSTQNEGLIGQGVPQVIDRSLHPKDTVKLSVSIPTIQGKEDERYVTLKINNAILELFRGTGGPVHINLATNYSKDYSVKEISPVRVIKRYFSGAELPVLNAKNTVICIGAHKKMSEQLTKSIELFCERYNSVVLCDHNSLYHGKYRIQANLILDQDSYSSSVKNIDLLIDIGEISGAYFRLSPKEVWRVGPEGELRDTYRTLRNIFQMDENLFFETYNKKKSDNDVCLENYNKWHNEYMMLSEMIPDLPFSNLWVAKRLSKQIPNNSLMYFGILNSLRSWNFFELDNSIESFSNTGGFGIDGGLSSLIGASFINNNKLYFAVIGDLSFFYDMNILGNRQLGTNVRILVINNGIGTEFKNYIHNASIHEGNTDKYIAAAGHFGNKSPVLIKHYSEDLGFKYITASNKEGFEKSYKIFVDEKYKEKPILFEIFTDCNNESNALKIMRNLRTDSKITISGTSSKLKQIVRDTLGDKRTNAIRDLFRG